MALKPPTYELLGTDLGLTRFSGTPGAVGLDSADSWGTLDLRVVPGGRGGLPQAGTVLDLSAVSGRENLAQALIVRLLTPQGTLTGLGHPGYGCRLVELIGELNNDTTRNLARLYTVEAVAQEHRVAALLDLAVGTPDGQPDVVRVDLAVLPVNDDQPLALSLSINL